MSATPAVKIVCSMDRQYHIKGDLDASYVARMKPEMEDLANSGQNVVMDLTHVEFVDSTGLGILVFIHKRLVSAGRKLKVVGLKGQPLVLFTNLQLMPVLCE
jgi:anti-sigma B factor antagonist